jgi:hypothetical protein
MENCTRTVIQDSEEEEEVNEEEQPPVTAFPPEEEQPPVTTYALEVFQKPSEISTVHIVQSVTSAEVLDEDVYPLFSKSAAKLNKAQLPKKQTTFQRAAYPTRRAAQTKKK